MAVALPEIFIIMLTMKCSFGVEGLSEMFKTFNSFGAKLFNESVSHSRFGGSLISQVWDSNHHHCFIRQRYKSQMFGFWQLRSNSWS